MFKVLKSPLNRYDHVALCSHVYFYITPDNEENTCFQCEVVK